MIFGLLIIAFGISYWFYKKTVPQLVGWNRWFLLILRTITISVVLILLFNPIVKFMRDKITKPQIVMLFDRSASMQQQGENASKEELFQLTKQALIGKLRSANSQVIEFDFANGLNGPDNNTLLVKTLMELTRKSDLENLEQIFLLSDGWLKDENLMFLENFSYPISTIAPEFSYTEFDLEINNVRFSSTAYRDEIVPIYFQIQSHNYSGKAKAILKVDNKRVQTRNFEFSESELLDQQFEHVFPEAGLHDLEILVETDSEEESNLANNRYPASIQIRDNKLKCLIIADKLSWDVSFILRSLTADDYWQTKFLLITDHYYNQRNITDFAVELEKTNTLVIVNHGELRLPFTDTDMIENFVSKGGGLIQIGNPPANLQSILPSDRINLNRTFEGLLRFSEESSQYHTFRWEDASVPTNIPPVRYYYVNPKLQARIFATIDNDQRSPAILYQNYDSGKVIHFAFLDLWKWQMWANGDHYKTFMHNLINWFGQQESDRIVAQTSRTSFFVGEQIEISLKVYTEQFNLTNDVDALLKLYNSENAIILEDYFTSIGNQLNLRISDLAAGKYRFEIEDKISDLQTSGEFSVLDFNPEMRDKGINDVILSYVVNATNGDFYNSIEEIEIPQLKNIVEEIQFEIPLYAKWYLIGMFLFSFCLELFFRKRWGLL